jgi:ubiquinone/menaquinone biosynthesis C-methylase UbiE
MKLNWVERWVVSNPLHVLKQRIEIDWMKKRGDLTDGSAALEVGCGRGAGARLILKAFNPATVHALDLDITMIQKSKRYLKRHDRDRIVPFVADLIHLPYDDGSMDAVFGFGVLHHIPNWRRAVAEISRVLKADGKYFLEEIYPWVYQNWLTGRILLHPREDRFESGDLRAVLTHRGLRISEVLEIPKVGLLAIAVKERP